MDIKIGDYIISDGMIRFDLWQSITEISTFEAEFGGYVPDVPSTKISLTHGNKVIFTGTGQLSSGKLTSENEVSVLAGMKISQVLLNCDPQEVIKVSLVSSGLELVLEKTAYPKKNVFVVSGLSGIELLEKVSTEWNRPFLFYLLDGKLFWGEITLVQDSVAYYEAGKNIIGVTYDADAETGKITGFLDLDLKLGQGLKISDPDVPDLTYTIDKLHHYRQSGKTRTDVHFRRVSHEQ